MKKFSAILIFIFLCISPNFVLAAHFFNEKDYDWNKVPRIGTKQELARYIARCEKNLQTVIPVILINGLQVDQKEVVTDMLVLPWVYSEVISINGSNTKMIYEIKCYSGSRVAYAYRTKNLSVLTTPDEKKLYNLAAEFADDLNKNIPSALAKEFLIHEVIVGKASYYQDNNYPKASVPNFKTAVGALIDGKANCQGYSDAFYMLGTMCGLNVDRTHGFKKNSSPGDDGHAWNTIKFSDGKIYSVDVTFDDRGKWRSYIYFNAPTEIMRVTHSWNDYAPNFQKTIDNRYFFHPKFFESMGVGNLNICVVTRNSAAEVLNEAAKRLSSGKISECWLMCSYDSYYAEHSRALDYLSGRLKVYGLNKQPSLWVMDHEKYLYYIITLK